MKELLSQLKQHSSQPQMTEDVAQRKGHSVETEGQAELSKEP